MHSVRPFAAVFISGFFSVLAAPAAAQDALDRVEPALRSQDRARDQVTPAPPASVPVEIEDAGTGDTSGSGPVVTVGAIVLVGLDALTPADFADVLVTRVGRSLTPADLRALATAIAHRAQEKGYALAAAWIEPQRLASGVLSIRVDEGRIDELRFDGGADAAVRDALAPLINGKPVRMGDIEGRMLIAGDIDGANIRSSRFFRENGKGVLLVRVSREHITARASVSNEGTRPLGPVQARIDVDINGVLFSDDSFSLTYSATPTEMNELGFGRVRYAKRVSVSGTEVAITGTASRARPGAYLRSLDLESTSWAAGVSILQPLLRRRNANLWFEGELGVRTLDQRRAGLLRRHDRTATVRATLYGNLAAGGGRLRFSTTLSQGLDLLDATASGDPLASRVDADGTFTSLNAWTDWTVPLARQLSLRLAVQSQLASQPLLVTEEFGMGGTAFLRGYDWSERSGDQGVVGLAELRYMFDRPFGLAQRAQLYAFVDGGKVTNLENGFGGGTLASAGGGIRTDLSNRLGANLEIAAPLTGPRYDTGDESPKINFRLVRAF